MLALIVDDSSTIRRMMTRFIQPFGFYVYEAVDGQDALERLEEMATLPDLALIDWHMPRMTGLELLRAIREMPELRGMTRIMVTSESEQGSVVRALAAGAHDYLFKPCTAQTLRERLETFGFLAGQEAGTPG